MHATSYKLTILHETRNTIKSINSQYN